MTKIRGVKVRNIKPLLYPIVKYTKNMGVYVSKVGGNIKILIIVVCVYKYIRKQNHMFSINVILMFPHIPRARGIYHSFHSHVESSLCTYNLTTLYSD